ncbi:hypothetical protein QBC39DRAFT_102240 [Podospora conica]|nr:hypothetical protein QBC39DRAFT_102240 [Schizothecium conicum]
MLNVPLNGASYFGRQKEMSTAAGTKLIVYRHVFAASLLETSMPLTGLGERLMRGLPTTRETPFCCGGCSMRGSQVPWLPTSPAAQTVSMAMHPFRNRGNMEAGRPAIPSGTERATSPLLWHLVRRECKGRSGISISSSTPITMPPCHRRASQSGRDSRARLEKCTAAFDACPQPLEMLDQQKPPRAVCLPPGTWSRASQGPVLPALYRDPRADLVIDDGTLWDRGRQ